MATVKVFGGKSYDDKYFGKNYTNYNAVSYTHLEIKEMLQDM